MKPRIYYTKPSITDLEVEYATDAARNGWGEHCYDYINKFEAAFKDHLGSEFAIAFYPHGRRTDSHGCRRQFNAAYRAGARRLPRDYHPGQ